MQGWGENADNHNCIKIKKRKRDTEIKNKLTVARGEDNGGGEGGRVIRNMYKGPMDKAKGGGKNGG